MEALDRSVAIVTGKPAFLEWINRVDTEAGDEGPVTFEEMNEEPMVILLPEFETLDDGMKNLQKMKPLIFEYMMEAWWTDDADWIQDTSSQNFDRHFNVVLSSVAVDFVPGPIEKEEL